MIDSPYGQPQQEKELLLLQKLNALSEHHQYKCAPYAKLIKLFWKNRSKANSLKEVPYLPVNLFKTQDLKSIEDAEVFKVLRSSGTTSLHPSKVYLSREASKQQTEALAEVITSFIGPERLPMLVFDHPNLIKDRTTYNARGAALIGMLTFGKNTTYALAPDGLQDQKGILEWCEKHKNEPCLLFGPTGLVYEHLKALEPLKISLPQGMLIHNGGWKKLEEQAITNEKFKELLKRSLGVTKCHNFYGMVEQIGSVFMECEEGYFHAPSFSDVLIRDARTWQEAPIGEKGVVEVLSSLPDSYPGHALLTEDLGLIAGIDDCPCGRKGKRFKIEGRVPRAEIRGCSDTYSFGQPT